MPQPKILCVVGPTACGKTKMGVLLARRFGGEVVSVDSMQIYRGMTIGTAAPTPEETEGVPHHMVAIADPAESWSVARFTEEADRCVQDILRRGKLPILVGGTGLYLDAIISGRTFAPGEAGGTVRKELEAQLAREGIAPLWSRWTRKRPHGSTWPTKSGSYGPWRSTGRQGSPSQSTTAAPPFCPGATIPSTSALPSGIAPT